MGLVYTVHARALSWIPNGPPSTIEPIPWALSQEEHLSIARWAHSLLK